MEKGYLIAILWVCIIFILLVGILCIILVLRRNDAKSDVKQQDKVPDASTNQAGGVMFDNAKLTFEEALAAQGKGTRKLYDEIMNYFSSLPETTAQPRKYHMALNYGKGKPVAKLSFKKDVLVVTTNIGTFDSGIDEISSLELKPRRIYVTDEESLSDAKEGIHEGYVRQSLTTGGQHKQSKEGQEEKTED